MAARSAASSEGTALVSSRTGARARKLSVGVPVMAHGLTAATATSRPAQALPGINVVTVRRTLRSHLARLARMVFLLDAVSAAAVFIFISEVRFTDTDWDASWGRFGLEPWAVVAVWATFWVAALWYKGSYRFQLRLSTRGDIEQVFAAGLIMAAVVFSAFFLTGDYAVSRLLLISLCVAQPVFTIAVRIVSRRGLAEFQRHGLNPRQTLIVGAGKAAQEWADRIERHPELGLQVIGHLRDDNEPAGATSRPVFGSLDKLASVLGSRVVDEISICLPADRWSRGVAVAVVAREAGKIVRIPILDGDLAIAGGSREDLDGVEVVTLVYGPEHRLGLALKRLFDIIASSVGLLVLSPLLLGVAAWILIREGRPIFFVQKRVGVNGRVFDMVKFRTMVPDAEARLTEVAGMNTISGPALQLDDDPRVTNLGRLLRRTSLDELPQLWNTLKGEMSIIGPRPAPVVEVAGYDLWHRRRLSMKPGITGLAQVVMRKYQDFDDRARLDLRYIDDWSLAMDARVLIQTLPLVIGGSGR
jgi:exopolysaccharide biosynthesis polyprenyl glycosylphosphotransferase